MCAVLGIGQGLGICTYLNEATVSEATDNRFEDGVWLNVRWRYSQTLFTHFLHQFGVLNLPYTSGRSRHVAAV
jgi:hypothetical protein